MKKVFISIPITGVEEVSKDKCKILKVCFEELFPQYTPIFPFDIAPLDNMPTSYYMSKDIEILMNCDFVIACKGWEESKGCRCEKFIAETYGIEWITLTDFIHNIVSLDNSITDDKLPEFNKKEYDEPNPEKILPFWFNFVFLLGNCNMVECNTQKYYNTINGKYIFHKFNYCDTYNALHLIIYHITYLTDTRNYLMTFDNDLCKELDYDIIKLMIFSLFNGISDSNVNICFNGVEKSFIRNYKKRIN